MNRHLVKHLLPGPLCLIPVLVLALVLQGSVSSSALHALEVGMEGPELTLYDLKGTPQRLAALKGEKLTALLFWATWGDNSVKALKQMQAMHQKYKDAGLSVLGINVDQQEVSDETVAKVKDAAAAQKITFPIYVDRGLAAFGSYGVIAVPTTLILDKDRVIRHELSGFPLVGSASQKQYIESVFENRTVAAAQIAAGPQPDKKAVRLWNMGVRTQRSERTAGKAKTWFQKAIEADPTFVLPYISLGELYRGEKNLVEAKKQFEHALRHKPEHVVALASLGQVLLMEGDLPGAEDKLQRAVKSDDSYLPTFYVLGLLKGRQGDLAQSQRWFERAEQLNPRDYRIYLHKAQLSEERGDLAAAAAAYNKALALLIGLP